MRFIILALPRSLGVCLMIAKLFVHSDLRNDHCGTDERTDGRTDGRTDMHATKNRSRWSAKVVLVTDVTLPRVSEKGDMAILLCPSTNRREIEIER